MEIHTSEKRNNEEFAYLGELPFIFDDILPGADVVVRAQYFKHQDGSILINLADESAWAAERIEELTDQIIANGELDQMIERYRDE